MIRGSDMLLTDEAWVDGVKQVAAGSPDESQSMASTPHLYTHLPPRLLLIIIADVSGLGEQRAGERRQLTSLRTLTRTQDTYAARPLFVC